MRIILNDEFYIDSDPLNYILKHRVAVRANKGHGELTGNHQDYVVGYFRTINGCVERFVQETQKCRMDDFSGDMKSYVEKLGKELESAVKEVRESVRCIYD